MHFLPFFSRMVFGQQNIWLKKMTENECLIHPIYRKRTKKEKWKYFFSPCMYHLASAKKYFFEVVMEMMRPLQIPSGDNDDDAEDDEAVASPLAGNCGGADMEIFRSIRGSAHLSFSSFSFSSAFSYISNFSQSPHVPILLLNPITFQVGHRLLQVTFWYPIHITLKSLVSKSSPWQYSILAAQKKVPDP